MAEGVATKEELINSHLSRSNVVCVIVFAITVFFLVFGTIQWGWYISELSALFMIAMIVSGLVSGVMPIMAPLSDMIGLSRQIAVLAFQFGDGYSGPTASSLSPA